MAERKGTEFRGTRNLKRLAQIPQEKQKEEIRRSLEHGLEAADSVVDRTISCFSRGHQPAFAGINTFMKAPYCEDVRKVGRYEAAFVGVPFDTATTFRPGARFGPQAVRRISALYDGYSIDGAVDGVAVIERRDAPHRLRSEPRARAEGGRGVEGHAHEGGLVPADLPDVLAVRRLHEGINPREGGLMTAAEAGDGPIDHGVRGLEPVLERAADLLFLLLLRDLREPLQVARAAKLRPLALRHAIPPLGPSETKSWRRCRPASSSARARERDHPKISTINQGCFRDTRSYYPLGSDRPAPSRGRTPTR